MPAHILVVDDEGSIVDMLAEIFQAAGYRTSCALSGEEAISKARETCPNLLLCDVMMPGLNGFQVALRVKRLCPPCQILLFSAYDFAALSSSDHVRALRDEGCHFEVLAKPISPKLLLSKIRETLGPSQGE